MIISIPKIRNRQKFSQFQEAIFFVNSKPPNYVKKFKTWPLFLRFCAVILQSRSFTNLTHVDIPLGDVVAVTPRLS